MCSSYVSICAKQDNWNNNIVKNFQIAAGKMMEQGPMLVISFIAQQIMCVRDKKGQLIEGDPVSFIS
jgi:hypothetical protein